MRHTDYSMSNDLALKLSSDETRDDNIMKVFETRKKEEKFVQKKKNIYMDKTFVTRDRF